jgi:D-psicose/D-tagatose/L-ribulose 3-epimerase
LLPIGNSNIELDIVLLLTAKLLPMPKLGMNLLLWTTEMEEEMIDVLRFLKGVGFDGVEIPIFDYNPQKWQKWSQRLDDLELERVGVTFCTAEANPIDPNPDNRKRAIENLKQAVECAAILGTQLLSGPIHSALGVFSGKGPTAQELEWAVNGVREVAEHAFKHQITLGIEYLNRFENYLLTNAEDTLRFVEKVNHKNCQIMFDTFHANIEEKNIGAALQSNMHRVPHIQISENDRSTPGKGNVDWEGVFNVIKGSNYEGWLSIEAFGMNPPHLAANTRIWRKMFESEEQLAKDGFAFLKRMTS